MSAHGLLRTRYSNDFPDLYLNPEATNHAEELVRLVRPVDSGLPQRAGVKDYAPDGSWLEGKRLQTYYDDQHHLLSEERVKKLASLARGEWQPSLGKVLVTKEVGKFWSHFGHMDAGKKTLYPEEAMFLLDELTENQAQYVSVEVLMDSASDSFSSLILSSDEVFIRPLCINIIRTQLALEVFSQFQEPASLSESVLGQMEVYYGGLPLSLQEAHASLLGHTVPVEHYQVFTHLARLGYTLRRHEPVEMMTAYERKIHLDKHQIKKSRKGRKRPRHPTPKEPSCTKEDTEKEDVSSVKKPKPGEELFENCAKQTDTQCGATLQLEGETCSLSGGSNTEKTTADLKIENPVGMYLNNCITGNIANISPSASASSSHHVPYSDWDFSSIAFPDFQHRQLPVELRVPESKPLPEDTQCYNATVERHRVGHISRQALQVGSETSHGHSLKSRAQNWGEYKDGLARLSADDKLLLCTPAPCLWKGDVTPLVKPHQATSTNAVLEKLKLSQNIDVTRIDVKRRHNKNVFPKIVYDVFLPDSKFKKSDPGQPDHRTFVVKQEDPPPTLSQIQELSCQSSDGVALNWAVVDNGDIAFYSFNLVDLPRDTSFL